MTMHEIFGSKYKIQLKIPVYFRVRVLFYDNIYNNWFENVFIRGDFIKVLI